MQTKNIFGHPAVLTVAGTLVSTLFVYLSPVLSQYSVQAAIAVLLAGIVIAFLHLLPQPVQQAVSGYTSPEEIQSMIQQGLSNLVVDYNRQVQAQQTPAQQVPIQRANTPAPAPQYPQYPQQSQYQQPQSITHAQLTSTTQVVPQAISNAG